MTVPAPKIEEYFIAWADKQLGGNTAANKEAYGDVSAVYRIKASDKNYFLKIGSGLAKERDRLEWIGEKLPVPRAIGFTHIEDTDGLLLSEIEGVNLAELSKTWAADKVIDKLTEALHQFHAADAKNCPFGNTGPGKVLVHGDACLPNFVFKGNKLSGYIDLGDVRIDSPETDLSAAVWSLQYNLGPGHGLKFLAQYGVKNATESLVEELRVQYEKMQKEWGLE